MDESVVKVFEEQKVGTLKLSQAIRIGADLIREGRVYISDDCACALGTAAAAMGHPRKWRGMYSFTAFMEARFPYVPMRVMEEVSLLHYMRKMDRAQLADWLEAQGY